MRSYEADPTKVDELKLVCEFPSCSRTFYTTNPKAVYCCDSHRAKHFRMENEERLKHERDWSRAFKMNYEILWRLYQQGEILVSLRELKLLGFDFSVMAKPAENKEGRTCYTFFDCGIMQHSSKPNMFEIYIVEK